LFLRVSNVKETGIETGSSDKYINNNLFSSLQIFQPEINELLLTKDGTPGICYVVDEIIDGIISGGIVKIKIINTSIPSEYLALVINSKICRMQVERVCSGALIVHWKPGDISKLQIPILSDGMMKKLSKLVAKSKQAKRESQQLLNQAQTRVEQLIEEAAGKNE
jgi:restriction endonuclease S subunit